MSNENLSTAYPTEEFNIETLRTSGYEAFKQLKQGEQIYVLQENLNQEYNPSIDYSETKYTENNWEDLQIVFQTPNHYAPIPEKFEEHQSFEKRTYQAEEKVKSRSHDGSIKYFELGTDPSKLKGEYIQEEDYSSIQDEDVLVKDGKVYL